MRLFLALAPDEAARAALARTACMLRPLAPGRYVPPSLYHITLAFLGETDAARLPAVREAMEAAAQALYQWLRGNVRPARKRTEEG